MPTKNTTNTYTYREKNRDAELGNIDMPQVSKVAFGDGGADAEGNPVEPSPDLEEVPGEFITKTEFETEIIGDRAYRVKFELGFDEGIGEDVSSCGLYDQDDDLMAVKNFAETPKTDENRIPIEFDRQF